MGRAVTMISKHGLAETFIGSVTVGERGQVVIPAEARERCGIESGDKLLSFVHPGGGGVFFLKLDALAAMSEELRQIVETPLSGGTETAPEEEE
jgi:AbrB family looped-hinge helix DNA binding protein